MKKVLFIISYINKSNNLEWFFEELSKVSNIQTNIILLGKKGTPFEQKLRVLNVKVKVYLQSSRIDFFINLVRVFIFQIFWRPNVVHTHLREATLIGIFTSWLLHIKKRIYSRHTANYNHLYHPKSMVFDKIINLMSTKIIAISINVANILKVEGVQQSKIALIHHGFKKSEFENISNERINSIKNKYCINSNLVIGVISRYIHLKGYQYIIPALSKIKLKYPSVQFVFANASGPYKKEIEKLIHQYDIENNLIEIPFEEDVIALFKTFDLFIHTPINEEIEAFGQIYVESQLLGIPSIVTLSGVAPEFLKSGYNTFVVPFKNSKAIYEAIEELLENHQLKEEIVKNGHENISKKFSIEEMVNNHVKLYLND